MSPAVLYLFLYIFSCLAVHVFWHVYNFNAKKFQNCFIKVDLRIWGILRNKRIFPNCTLFLRILAYTHVCVVLLYFFVIFMDHWVNSMEGSPNKLTTTYPTYLPTGSTGFPPYIDTIHVINVYFHSIISTKYLCTLQLQIFSSYVPSNY